MDARYSEGQAVRVRTGSPTGHCRTPFYLRGQDGVVARVLGPFPDPEKLAYGKPGYPWRVLYQVRFQQPALWHGDGGYDGPAADSLVVDVFEHWLEPAP